MNWLAAPVGSMAAVRSPRYMATILCRSRYSTKLWVTVVRATFQRLVSDMLRVLTSAEVKLALYAGSGRRAGFGAPLTAAATAPMEHINTASRHQPQREAWRDIIAPMAYRFVLASYLSCVAAVSAPRSDEKYWKGHTPSRCMKHQLIALIATLKQINMRLF